MLSSNQIGHITARFMVESWTEEQTERYLSILAANGAEKAMESLQHYEARDMFTGTESNDFQVLLLIQASRIIPDFERRLKNLKG